MRRLGSSAGPRRRRRYADLTGVIVPQAVPRIAPDPDDDMVIGTALAARTTLIVTGDGPLLSLLRYQTVEIVSTAQALQRITV